MLVAVSGANGFTGRFVCKELLRRDIPFIALLRPGSDPSWMNSFGIPYIFGGTLWKNRWIRNVLVSNKAPQLGCRSLRYPLLWQIDYISG